MEIGVFRVHLVLVCCVFYVFHFHFLHDVVLGVFQFHRVRDAGLGVF